MLHHKKVVVISLGGSVMVPSSIDTKFLHKFHHTLAKHYRTHKFVIVAGGGAIARTYISALRKEHKSEKELSLVGIRATRMNAQFLMQLFGKKEANDTLPANMHDILRNLPKNNVVICGALRWSPHSTSDSTTAKLAHLLNTEFINITNVEGLFTADPKTHQNAKLIRFISWQDFEKKALFMKFTPGQHFVLDQQAASLIREHHIQTYIIGPNLNNLNRLLKGKSFKGTTIYG